jgi:hypothetical protein
VLRWNGELFETATALSIHLSLQSPQFVNSMANRTVGKSTGLRYRGALTATDIILRQLRLPIAASSNARWSVPKHAAICADLQPCAVPDLERADIRASQLNRVGNGFVRFYIPLRLWALLCFLDAQIFLAQDLPDLVGVSGSFRIKNYVLKAICQQ